MHFRDDLQEEGIGHFLKLKDKETITGIFAGEVYDFRQHWIKSPQTNKSEVCTGHGCQHCAQGNKAQFRFRINFILRDKETNQYVAKIFEQGLTVYKSLRELHKEFPLQNTIVKITRSGATRQDTTYSVIPSANRLTPEIAAVIANTKLHDLVTGGEPVIEDTSFPPFPDAF